MLNMNYKYRVWFHGIVAGVLATVGNSVGNMVVDPEHFNVFVHGSWVMLGSTILVSIIVSIAIYLKEHPLPSPEKDNDYVSVVREQMAEIKGTGDGKN